MHLIFCQPLLTLSFSKCKLIHPMDDRIRVCPGPLRSMPLRLALCALAAKGDLLVDPWTRICTGFMIVTPKPSLVQIVLMGDASSVSQETFPPLTAPAIPTYLLVFSRKKTSKGKASSTSTLPSWALPKAVCLQNVSLSTEQNLIWETKVNLVRNSAELFGI